MLLAIRIARHYKQKEMGTLFARIFRSRQVRTRLTLWYVFVLVSVLLLSWGLTASFLFLQLRAQLDHYAIQDIETVEGLLHFDAHGRLDLREDYHNHPESKQILERFLGSVVATRCGCVSK